MCYHKSQTHDLNYLADYYSASYSDVMAEVYQPIFHENGFDFKPSPVLTAGKPGELQLFNWGMIPFWVNDLPSALKLRISTLNCISEEMFDKPSFRDAAKEGKRCLIPCTGFYEWRWLNPDDKKSKKIPYFIQVSTQPLFSVAGLYSRWNDKAAGQYHYTYTVLTTKANPMMDKIHNTKHRMPVIIPREHERDWLNPNLTKDDVLALCRPYSDAMKAHTISKLITSKTEETNVPDVQKEEFYPELNSD